MSTLTTAVYGVNGMTGDHCVRAVTAEVGVVDGVTDVHVDLADGTVTVRSDREIDPAAVHEAIDEAGYAVRS